LQTTGGAQSFSSRKKPTPVRIIMLVVGIPKLEEYQSFKMFFQGGSRGQPLQVENNENMKAVDVVCVKKKCFGKKVGALFVKELVEADVFINVFLLKLV